MSKNYYEILNLPKTATREEIKKAYFKLAKIYHPDVNKSPDAEERFKEITEAYEVLYNPETRKQYDDGNYHEEQYSYGGEYKSTIISYLQTRKFFIDWMNEIYWESWEVDIHGRQSMNIVEIFSNWYQTYCNNFPNQIVSEEDFNITLYEYVLNKIDLIEKNRDLRNIPFLYIEYSDIYPTNSSFYNRSFFNEEIKVDFIRFLEGIKQQGKILFICNSILEIFYNSNDSNEKFEKDYAIFVSKVYSEFILPKYGSINYKFFKTILLYPFYRDAYEMYDKQRKAYLLSERKKYTSLKELPFVGQIINLNDETNAVIQESKSSSAPAAVGGGTIALIVIAVIVALIVLF